VKEIIFPKINEIKWPEWDESKLVKQEVEYAIQVNNKIITRLNVPTNLDNAGIEDFVKNDNKVKEILADKNIVKCIVISGRLVNFIAK